MATVAGCIAITKKACASWNSTAEEISAALGVKKTTFRCQLAVLVVLVTPWDVMLNRVTSLRLHELKILIKMKAYRAIRD